MRKNKILGVIFTVIAICALGMFYWQHHNQGSAQEASKEPLKDNRTQITDQVDAKYKSTVLINSTEKKTEFGTGYVIGRNTVATNRHVVQEVKNKPDKAVVRVGHKDASGKVSFKEFKIKDIVLPKDKTMDVAVLKLKPAEDGKSIGDCTEIAQFGDSSKVKQGTELTLVGYPGDKEYATMWTGTGEVDMVSDSMISFRIISAPGNSGSPLFDADGKVVAMNNAGGDNNSFGFLIDKPVLSFFKSNIE